MATSKKPNFLFIIADDLGYSDIGPFGGEIHTPNLDKLSEDGTRLLNYHTAAACSPTRAMVLSGTDAHMAGLGVMIEYKANEVGSKRWAGKGGHEGFMNKEVAPISEILQDNGYFTTLSGKWHLGLRADYGPHARGFDKSMALLPGCCNHSAWEPQLDADGESPMRMGGRPIHAEDGKAYKIEPNTNEDRNGFFSSYFYPDKMVEYLEGRTPDERKKPFFGYLAFSAPHWPCQSWKRYREKYRDVYADGPEALRKRRLAKMVEMGIISENVVPHEIVAPDSREWDSLDDYEKQSSAAAMAAYAGQIEQLDEGVGTIIDYLKKTDQYDNTFIIFMSDNGAEGAALEAIPVMGTQIMKVIAEYYDNSLENIGAYNSYPWIGERWAQASTAPSRLYKTFSSEGGILVPAIVKAPMFNNDKLFPRGGFNRSFTNCSDLAPTICDLLNIKLPPSPAGDGKLIHRGRTVHPMRGKSWTPAFMRGEHADSSGDELTAVYGDQDVIGWELFTRAALRQGRWKIVHLPPKYGGAGKDNTMKDNGEGWELFDIVDDPGEVKDLAEANPQKLKDMLALWDEYVRTTQVVWGEDALAPGLSKEEAPLLHDNTRALQRNWVHLPNGAIPSF